MMSLRSLAAVASASVALALPACSPRANNNNHENPQPESNGLVARKDGPGASPPLKDRNPAPSAATPSVLSGLSAPGAAGGKTPADPVVPPKLPTPGPTPKKDAPGKVATPKEPERKTAPETPKKAIELKHGDKIELPIPAKGEKAEYEYTGGKSMTVTFTAKVEGGAPLFIVGTFASDKPDAALIERPPLSTQKGTRRLFEVPGKGRVAIGSEGDPNAIEVAFLEDSVKSLPLKVRITNTGKEVRAVIIPDFHRAKN